MSKGLRFVTRSEKTYHFVLPKKNLVTGIWLDGALRFCLHYPSDLVVPALQSYGGLLLTARTQIQRLKIEKTLKENTLLVLIDFT